MSLRQALEDLVTKYDGDYYLQEASNAIDAILAEHPEAECEAHRRNKQAVYEIELSWGNGIIELGKLKGILTDRDDAERCGTDVVDS